MVKPCAIVALSLGLAASVALVVYFGAGGIAAAFARLGFLGFIVFCAAHAPAVALLGLGWRVCLPDPASISLRDVTFARLLREAGAEVLPFSELGGFVIGARTAVLAGVSALDAAASTLADLTTEVAAQLAFIALGLAALYGLRPDAALIRPAALALVVLAALMGLAIVLAQRGFRPAFIERGVQGWFARFGDAAAAFATLGTILRRRSALAQSFALHLAGWIGVALEAWLALRLIDAPISLAGAVALESLLFATRSLAFFAPNAVGVQEGAYVLLAPLVGLSASDALALSLVKRARDIVIGAPALLIWQRIEAARIWGVKRI